MKKFKSEKQLAKYIQKKQGTLWRVGGCVRDSLLHLSPHDVDYMITGWDQDTTKFDKIVGSFFPVFLVEIKDTTHEIALARTEKKNGKGYHGFSFFSHKSITIIDDLARRDLTMNSIAVKVLTNELIDPFNGIDDINNKTIRHTTIAFKEDPLRVYRTARFAAQLGFTIHSSTLKMMKSLKKELYDLKPERVLKEFEKVLNYDNPRIFFDTLKSIDCLNVHFKEINDLDRPDKHDGTSYEHTMRLLEHGKSSIERFCLLVHDIGKGTTPIEECPSHIDHDKRGVEPFNNFCDRLKINNHYRKMGLMCIKEHMRIKKLNEMRSKKIIDMCLKYSYLMYCLWHISHIDSMNRDKKSKHEEEYEKIDKLILIAMLTISEINGEYLMKKTEKKGKEFGELLMQERIRELNKRRKNE
jgi:tRNA nucleotidyltransferase (CCA-adding enzyme)